MGKPQSEDERRKRDIGYQENRKKRLDNIGENKVAARLDNIAYAMFADLFEDLGRPRPVASQRNLIDNSSIVIKHLINKAYKPLDYKPKSPEAKELYRLHKMVIQLICDNSYTSEQIIEKMKKENRRSPGAILKGEQRSNWTEGSISRLINTKSLLKKLQKLDGVADK